MQINHDNEHLENVPNSTEEKMWRTSEISPYVYCANNLLNLTFPDSMDWYKDIN